MMPRQTDRGSQDVRALGAGPGGCKKYDSGAVKKLNKYEDMIDWMTMFQMLVRVIDSGFRSC